MLPDAIAQARAELEERNKRALFGVWPENWHAVVTMCAMDTQWRVQLGFGAAMWTGLDYAALPLVLRACRPTVPREMRRPLHVLMPQLLHVDRAVIRIRNAG